MTVTAAFALWYFTPSDVKQKGVDFLTENKIVPEAVRETANNIFKTPAEQRQKLMSQLESRLAELKENASSEKISPQAITAVIAEAESIIAEIKKKNEDKPGLITETAKKLLGLQGNAEKSSCPTSN